MLSAMYSVLKVSVLSRVYYSVKMKRRRTRFGHRFRVKYPDREDGTSFLPQRMAEPAGQAEQFCKSRPELRSVAMDLVLIFINQ